MNMPVDDNKEKTVNSPPSKTPAWIEKIRKFRDRIPFVIRLLISLIFLALGVLGLFLPVLQGGLFLFIAFWLLFPHQSERLVEKIRSWLSKRRMRHGKKNQAETEAITDAKVNDEAAKNF